MWSLGNTTTLSILHAALKKKKLLIGRFISMEHDYVDTVPNPHLQFSDNYPAPNPTRTGA